MATKDEVKERIQSALYEKRCSVSKLAGVHGSAIQVKANRQINGDTALTSDVIRLFLSTFPDVSAEWLLRGEGEMYRSGSKDIVINNTNSHHNISGSGTLTQNNNSGDTELLKKVIADKDAQIAELKKDKELLGNLLQALTKR